MPIYNMCSTAHRKPSKFYEGGAILSIYRVLEFVHSLPDERHVGKCMDPGLFVHFRARMPRTANDARDNTVSVKHAPTTNVGNLEPPAQRYHHPAWRKTGMLGAVVVP